MIIDLLLTNKSKGSRVALCGSGGMPARARQKRVSRAEPRCGRLLHGCYRNPVAQPVASHGAAAPIPVVLGRLNGRDGRVKPEPPIRRPLRTGPAGMVRITARQDPPRRGGSGREAGLTRTARPLIIGGDGDRGVSTAGLLAVEPFCGGPHRGELGPAVPRRLPTGMRATSDSRSPPHQHRVTRATDRISTSQQVPAHRPSTRARHARRVMSVLSIRCIDATASGS